VLRRFCDILPGHRSQTLQCIALRSQNGQSMATTADIIDAIARRLSEGGYKVSHDVILPEGPVAKVAASRTYFSWKGLVVLSQHIVVRQLDNATAQDVRELFEAGFRFGKHANWVPCSEACSLGTWSSP
jgi:hypothetical protein